MTSAKPTVLLVEDEADTRDLLGRALERAGYSVLPAADAEGAVEHVKEGHSLDVIVTDVTLGNDDRGGLRLITDLRRRDVRAPIIVITAYADVEKVKFALNEGASHLLEKPFRAPDLIAAIERVRGGTSTERSIERLFETARLTEKERVVAGHLLRGLTSNEIGELLLNSPKTIRQHVSQIYAKCGVGTRAELFRLVFAR